MHPERLRELRIAVRAIIPIGEVSNDHKREAIALIDAELAKPVEAQVCPWTQVQADIFHTCIRRYQQFRNPVSLPEFCPDCGKRVEVA